MSNKNILRLLPFAGAFLIFFAFLKLTLYYRVFNISIVNYLVFSEIITSFLEDIVFYIFTFAFIIIIVYFSAGEKKISPRRTQIFQEQNFFKRFILYAKVFKGILVLSVVIFTICLVILWFFKKIDIFFLISMLIFMLSGFLFLVVLLEIDRKSEVFFKKHINVKLLYLLMIVGFLLIFIITRVYEKVHSVKKEKLFYNVKFEIDGSTICSDSSSYYIGETQNFLFFHNEKTKETAVYPKSRIRMISFPSRRKLLLNY